VMLVGQGGLALSISGCSCLAMASAMATGRQWDRMACPSGAFFGQLELFPANSVCRRAHNQEGGCDE
jgi:hypothetical protein